MPPTIVVVVVAFTIALATSPAAARTIHVSPGPGTPLQDAIDGAAPGDRIQLDEALYPETVIIGKELRLRGARATPPLHLGSRIDAGCAAATALTIAADDVEVRAVSVQGGTFSTIDITNRARVTLRDVVALGGVFSGCDAVQYGINVSQSHKVRLIRSEVYGDAGGYDGAAGYHDAGVHIDGIGPGSDVRIQGLLPRIAKIIVGNARGIVVENSSGGVRIERMGLASNVTGILLRNSDHVLIQRNVVNDARGSGTFVGIELDANSDDNVISENTFVDAVTDAIDGGAGNCWTDNTIGTGTVPTGGCDD